jgi:dihydroxy-acid dehydratase
VGGPIALIEDGDRITIDAEVRRVDIDLSDDELEQRRAAWKRPKSSVTKGALAKYRAEVLSASQGAVTEAPPWDD